MITFSMQRTTERLIEELNLKNWQQPRLEDLVEIPTGPIVVAREKKEPFAFDPFDKIFIVETAHSKAQKPFLTPNQELRVLSEGTQLSDYFSGNLRPVEWAGDVYIAITPIKRVDFAKSDPHKTPYIIGYTINGTHRNGLGVYGEVYAARFPTGDKSVDEKVKSEDKEKLTNAVREILQLAKPLSAEGCIEELKERGIRPDWVEVSRLRRGDGPFDLLVPQRTIYVDHRMMEPPFLKYPILDKYRPQEGDRVALAPKNISDLIPCYLKKILLESKQLHCDYEKNALTPRDVFVGFGKMRRPTEAILYTS